MNNKSGFIQPQFYKRALQKVKRLIHFPMSAMISNVDTKTGAGFTLIETVLYIGIFTLALSSFLLVTYQIVQGTSASSFKVVTQEEGEFLIRKFAWALSGASTITVSSNLSVTKPSLPAAQNPLVFDLNSGNVRLARGMAAPIILNSANVTVTNLVFTDIPAALGSPQAVKIDFTLKDQTYIEPFETVRYLRK